MADSTFETLGPKSANSYLLVFVKGLGTEYIEQWVGQHAPNLFSVVQLSSIAATKLIGAEVDDDDEEAIFNMSKDLYPIVLKRLESLDKINRDQRVELQNSFKDGIDLVNAFLPLSLELAKAETPEKAVESVIHVDDSSDSDDDSKKEKKPKLSKAEKKALKLQRAMAKKAQKIERRNQKLQEKLKRLSVSFSGDLDGDGQEDLSVSVGVTVEGDNNAENTEESEGAEGENKESEQEEDDDNVLTTLASVLGLDPASPVINAILAISPKNKVEQKDEASAQA